MNINQPIKMLCCCQSAPHPHFWHNYCWKRVLYVSNLSPGTGTSVL